MVLQKLVIDVTKPFSVPAAEIAEKIIGIQGVEGVNILSYGEEKKEELLRITIEGKNFKYTDVEAILAESSCTLLRTIEVIAGKKRVEPTLFFLEEEEES